jgi:hypothetical protein
MGYAKYTEDIEKIRSMNIFGTFLDLQPRPVLPIHRCDFCSYETHDREQRDAHILKEHREAAIYLEYDDHIVPDRAVFKVRPIHLKVRCPALPRGIEVSVSSRSQALSSRRFKEGDLLQITPPDEEIVILQLGIGAYKRHYDISFRHQTFVARWTPALAGELKSANSRIASWEWPDVDKFKAALLGEPGMSEDDKMHRHGIFEYYHALWLEQNRKLEYTQHFEEAFNSLRNFSDPLSQLIVSYFWYRVNSLESISPLIPFPRLRRVVAFFAGPFDDPRRAGTEKPKQPDGEYISCEIPIADADASVFAAASAIQASSWEIAMSECDSAERRMLPNDDQARYRVLFLRYRAHRLRGQTVETRRLAERLRACSVKLFQSEAERYLSST